MIGAWPPRLLAALLAFVALNAFAGGVFGLSGAGDVPTEWLAGSPFENYFVPSLVLIVAVGGSSAAAALALMLGARRARVSALGAAAVLMMWMAVQLAILGYVSWLQPTFVGIAIAEAALATQLRG